MSYVADYAIDVPERAELEARPGVILLEFGVDWCPHCHGAQKAIAAALAAFPQVSHLKVEDGPGRRLGRSYRVKLWPTLIVLRDGQELGRIVRPGALEDILPSLRSAVAP